jgi:carbonic anhydrase
MLDNNPNVPGGPWKTGAFQYAESMSFLPIPEGASERQRLENSVREDVRYLQLHPLSKPSIPITGWIYDLATRKVERVRC